MSSGHTVIGGETDEDEKYIAPTVLADVTLSDPVMQEEVMSSRHMDIITCGSFQVLATE